MESRKHPKDWNENDYFEHYLTTKRFGFPELSTKPFHKNEFDIVLSELAKYKSRYYFFITKLVPTEKTRLKDIFLDNLDITKNKQTHRDFKTIIQKLIDEIETDNFKINKDENKIWFKVGLLFATGQIKGLMAEFNGNATQIAKHLKNKNYRPYISESNSRTSDNDKNIFSKKSNKAKKMQSIINHCKERNIEIDTDFISLLSTE